MLSTLASEVLALGGLIAFLLYRLYLVLMNTTVYDAHGKRMPGPMPSDAPVKTLRQGRKNKRVAEVLHEFMINRWGDGRLCGMSVFGRNVCFLGHPEDVKVILAGKHTDFPKASRYNRLKFVLNEGLVTSSGKVWQSHRRIMNAGFNAARYNEFVKTFAAKAELTVNEILDSAGNNANVEIDITKALGLLSYRIICEAGFGYKPDTKLMESEGFSPDTVTMILDEINTRLTHPTDWFHYLNFPREMLVNRRLAAMDRVVYDIIANRKAAIAREGQVESPGGGAEAGAEKDLLDVLLRASEAESEVLLSARDLRDHIFTFLAAGTETTATTTAWLLLELCRNPEVQKQVLSELDSVFGTKTKQGRKVAYEDIEKLVFLEAVMKETLRVHPPATVVGRECTRDTTLCSSEYTLKKGDTAICVIYSLHHNKEFWDHPERFDPSRFLPANIKKTLKSPWMYLPFSAGPRNCIGQRFARYEVLTVVATLLCNFTVSMSAEASASYRVEETLVRRPVGLRMTFTRRGTSSAPLECQEAHSVRR